MFGIINAVEQMYFVLFGGMGLCLILLFISLSPIAPRPKKNIDFLSRNEKKFVLDSTLSKYFKEVRLNDYFQLIFVGQERTRECEIDVIYKVAAGNGFKSCKLKFNDEPTAINLPRGVKEVAISVKSVNGEKQEYEKLIDERFVTGIIFSVLIALVTVAAGILLTDYYVNNAPADVYLDILLILSIVGVAVVPVFIVLKLVLGKAGK